MSRQSCKLVTVLAVLVAGASFAPPADAKPKPRRVTTQAESDEDADAAALSGLVNGTSQYTKFEADLVTGETQAPGGVNVQSRGDATMKSLLRIRGHFLRELVVMADDV